MPTFTTPNPVDLAVNLQVGSVEVVASERGDTVVTVAPSNPSKAVDRRGAEETKVEFDGSRITITGPRPRVSWFGPTESVDLRLEVPTGSRLTAEVAVGGVRSTGRLGATRLKCTMGPVDLDGVGDLWLRAGHGNASAKSAEGTVEVTADHGQIRLGTIGGDGILKASHGSIFVGESAGDLEVKLSYGDLDLTKARGSVSAKTAYGSLSLHEVASGSIDVETAFGQIVVGVAAGVPAWLDLASREGHVRNELTGDRAPDPTEQTVAVRARTQHGDISIRRIR